MTTVLVREHRDTLFCVSRNKLFDLNLQPEVHADIDVESGEQH